MLKTEGSEMTEIILTGLGGSNPIGALASFGLLRMSSRIDGMKGSKLRWRVRDQDGFPIDEATAVIDVPAEIDCDKLVHIIHKSVRYNENVFGWSINNDIKTKSTNFKQHAEKWNAKAGVDEREEIDYFSAYGTEVAIDDNGKIRRTLLHMVSGQQRFFDTVHKIYAVVEKDEEKIREAIFGPWKYEDDVHSLGWDPQTTRLHAYRNIAPTSDNSQSNAGVILLALQALPLFSTVPYQGSISKGAMLKTTGFRREGGNDVFFWPIWEPPIGLDALKTLLSSQELANGANGREALERRGVVSVYKCMRLEGEKGRFSFSSPEIVWSR